MEMTAISVVTAISHADDEPSIQAEVQDRSCRHPYLPASDRKSGAGGRTGGRADRGTLSASGDGPEDRAEPRAAADERWRVIRQPPVGFDSLGFGIDGITLAVGNYAV